VAEVLVGVLVASVFIDADVVDVADINKIAAKRNARDDSATAPLRSENFVRLRAAIFRAITLYVAPTPTTATHPLSFKEYIDPKAKFLPNGSIPRTVSDGKKICLIFRGKRKALAAVVTTEIEHIVC